MWTLPRFTKPNIRKHNQWWLVTWGAFPYGDNRKVGQAETFTTFSAALQYVKLLGIRPTNG